MFAFARFSIECVKAPTSNFKDYPNPNEELQGGSVPGSRTKAG
jgi:hypothetical protein